MAKRKGFDVIEDAHELSEHNFHASYWLNKVNSYTYATWMAEKKLSLICQFHCGVSGYFRKASKAD